MVATSARSQDAAVLRREIEELTRAGSRPARPGRGDATRPPPPRPGHRRVRRRPVWPVLVAPLATGSLRRSRWAADDPGHGPVRRGHLERRAPPRRPPRPGPPDTRPRSAASSRTPIGRSRRSTPPRPGPRSATPHRGSSPSNRRTVTRSAWADTSSARPRACGPSTRPGRPSTCSSCSSAPASSRRSPRISASARCCRSRSGRCGGCPSTPTPTGTRTAPSSADDVRTVNVWITLSPCGLDAPGLDVVPRRIDHLVETGSHGASLRLVRGSRPGGGGGRGP